MLSRRSVLAGLASAPLVPAFARAADPIKVGLIIPLSGGAGRQGQDVTHAVQGMAALINESGGVLGRPVEILVRDDESTPAIGVAKANELAAAGVAVVLEGWNSPVTLAMQSVLARAGILDITMISKADAILASASNPRQVRAITDAVLTQVRETVGRGPLRSEGVREQQWVLVDYGDVIVHIFSEETRRFYEIERLYKDVEPLDWAAAELS